MCRNLIRVGCQGHRYKNGIYSLSPDYEFCNDGHSKACNKRMMDVIANSTTVYQVLTILIILSGIIGLIVYLIMYVSWCQSHKRPLTDDEIKRLSRKRTEAEISKRNKLLSTFNRARYVKNTTLNPNGELVCCDISVKDFPSYIASQLLGKKYEWWVIGIAGSDRVVGYWVNRGDRNSVKLNVNFNSILSLCDFYKCNAIFDIHNHPNPNPRLYSSLIASNQDIKTSEELSAISAKNGISYISFVCSIGEWSIYYKKESNKLNHAPEYVTEEYIKKENGQSSIINLKLHKELGLFHK